MKKFMYFAAALLVLVGCNKKDNALNNAPEGTPFEKGQQVTLTVGAGAQQGPNRVAGVENTTDNQIDFKWEENDKILVKVSQKTAIFTLTTGEGTETGTFSGVMPASGTTFDIQYPIETPNLSAQVYTTDKPIPADKMAFAAEGCVLGESATLTAQYAMVQLNLFGTDKTVGKIVFTDKTNIPAKSYTLTCGGVVIGATSATATPFYMVVPADTYQFEAEIWDNATTPAEICSFATSAAKTFTAGECLNMPAKYVPTYVDLGLPSGLKWATCNLGATTPEGYGDYFAWGETKPKDNYNWSTYFDSEDGITFKKYNDGGDKTILDPEDDAAHVNWGGNWRMPTIEEQEELMNNCTWTWTQKNGINGYEVEGPNNHTIFLPAAGYRYESSLNYLGSYGHYWSSSHNEYYQDSAWDFYFYEYDKDRQSKNRSCGMPVRPVCQ